MLNAHGGAWAARAAACPALPTGYLWPVSSDHCRAFAAFDLQPGTGAPHANRDLIMTAQDLLRTAPVFQGPGSKARGPGPILRRTREIRSLATSNQQPAQQRQRPTAPKKERYREVGQPVYDSARYALACSDVTTE
ncbi:hypothetical protein StoSoilB22_39840 [Arthrobacter sp. StoSoilB22]|nr:hypothetical protein StoSoilB22_39840 [Arthrobacter sp. StoSoilB22]